MREIQDYLQTQALRLSSNEVAVSRAATLAVIDRGVAHIEPSVWLHDALPVQAVEHPEYVKRLFMAVDALFSRQMVQSVVLYAWLPAPEGETGELVRLVQQGIPVETVLQVNEEQAWQYLPVRTARSGWANIATDIPHWLAIGELRGEQNGRAVCQLSLPIGGEDGVVYGVLHVESAIPLPEDALAEWVGLALGVLPTMRELLPRAVLEDNEI